MCCILILEKKLSEKLLRSGKFPATSLLFFSPVKANYLFIKLFVVITTMPPVASPNCAGMPPVITLI